MVFHSKVSSSPKPTCHTHHHIFYFVMELVAFFLLLVANGSPILAKRLLGDRFSFAIDGGQLAPDGKPWLGSSKTFRGILASISMCAAIAPILGLPVYAGAIFAAYAMLGDLITSFIKRRMGLEPSSQLFGVDQALEAFIPLVACSGHLQLDWQAIILLTLSFWIAGIVLSRILFMVGIRKHPY